MPPDKTGASRNTLLDIGRHNLASGELVMRRCTAHRQNEVILRQQLTINANTVLRTTEVVNFCSAIKKNPKMKRACLAGSSSKPIADTLDHVFAVRRRRVCL